MNASQKAEIRATMAGNFAPISAIFDQKDIIPSVAMHAFAALNALLQGNSAILEQYEAEFNTHQILRSILFIREIIDHPCPQNRASGATNYYAVHTANGSYLGEHLLGDGLDKEHGFVYWNEPNGKREQRREKIGLLGLTAKQGNNEPPLTKENLLAEMGVLIQESYITYLESRTQQNESTLQAYPQLEFSPTQITCSLTNKIFHTPVILFTIDNQRSGIVEKERAIFFLLIANSESKQQCPFTRKPLMGYIVCSATQAMANQFWEKYQGGHYTQEFERFKPKPATLAQPDCFFLPAEQSQHARQSFGTAQPSQPSLSSEYLLSYFWNLTGSLLHNEIIADRPQPYNFVYYDALHSRNVYERPDEDRVMPGPSPQQRSQESTTPPNARHGDYVRYYDARLGIYVYERPDEVTPPGQDRFLNNLILYLSSLPSSPNTDRTQSLQNRPLDQQPNQIIVRPRAQLQTIATDLDRLLFCLYHFHAHMNNNEAILPRPEFALVSRGSMTIIRMIMISVASELRRLLLNSSMGRFGFFTPQSTEPQRVDNAINWSSRQFLDAYRELCSLFQENDHNQTRIHIAADEEAEEFQNTSAYLGMNRSDTQDQ